jgi:hypothetical protein
MLKFIAAVGLAVCVIAATKRKCEIDDDCNNSFSVCHDKICVHKPVFP